MTTVIADLGGPLYGLERRKAVAQALDLSIDRLVIGGRPRGAPPRRPCRPELGVRPHADLDREGQRRTGVGQIADVDVRFADRRDPGRVDRVHVPGPERLAQRLVEHILAAEAPDHHRRRDLALAEAGNLQLVAELASSLLHAALNLCGRDLGLDPHARLGQLGDGGSKCC